MATVNSPIDNRPSAVVGLSFIGHPDKPGLLELSMAGRMHPSPFGSRPSLSDIGNIAKPGPHYPR